MRVSFLVSKIAGHFSCNILCNANGYSLELFVSGYISGRRALQFFLLGFIL